MSAYLHLGHNSVNLVGEKGLDQFRGIILSPVNQPPEKMSDDLTRIRSHSTASIFFDPQLYTPRTARATLQLHDYYPNDIDSAAIENPIWWRPTIEKITNLCQSFGIQEVASPIFIPKGVPPDGFYSLAVELADLCVRFLTPNSVFLSLYIDASALDSLDSVLRISSIVSRTDAASIYLIINWKNDLRKEIRDETRIAHAMKLISSLSNAGKHVVVSYTGSELPMWIAAGASSCASGKFWNLRRFDPARFEVPEDGGGSGQVSYWFEESLLGFLREPDLLRVQGSSVSDLIGTGYSKSHWSDIILKELEQKSGNAWLKHSWRQYLAWFSGFAREFSAQGNRLEALEALLIAAEQNWTRLDSANILMDERANDGSWVRSWRQAIVKFKSFSDP